MAIPVIHGWRLVALLTLPSHRPTTVTSYQLPVTSYQLPVTSYQLDAGYQIVVVLGEPAFYQRFGFQAASLHGIHYWDVPAAFFLLKELQAGALVRRTGMVEYQPEFRGV